MRAEGSREHDAAHDDRRAEHVDPGHLLAQREGRQDLVEPSPQQKAMAELLGTDLTTAAS